MVDAARLRTLAALTIRAQDDERARIARELHDSAAQSVAALTYQLAAAARDTTDPALGERLREMRVLAGAVLEELRSMAHSMYPSVLDDLGLESALEWLVRKSEEHTHLDIQLETIRGGEPAELSREGAAALYRVAQESIRNIERHSGARIVRLSLVERTHYVSLDIVDDGHGFDLQEAATRRPGMGLFAMRERLGLVDGVLEIDSAPGRGTRIHASVPTGTDHLAYLPLVN
jgi:two-component system sensor histidine kinase UhpB